MKQMLEPAPYGTTIECECGKTHRIDPGTIVYAPDAVARMPRTLAPLSPRRRVTVLFDTRTREVAGAEVARCFRDSGWEMRDVLVPDPAPGLDPVCDEPTFLSVRESCADSEILLPVGSGVISDLGKWAASALNIPYACFATAASMNGHSSANVSASMGGVKVVVRARPPKAVFSSPSVLCNAPRAMTVSGLGDALAKSVSAADWRMNQVLFGDYFCERASALIAGIEPMIMDNPEGIRAREPAAIEGLFQALLLTGVAMTMAESSAPASGGEHLVSHTLDMMSALDGVPHAMHGSQVGIGTVLVSEVYRRVLEIESPVFSPSAISIDRLFWARLAGEVGKYYGQKVARIEQCASLLNRTGAWDALRETLAPYVRRPGQVRDCLKRAGAPYRARGIGCTAERLRTALLHAHEIRARFTVLDLARIVGVLPNGAGEIVEEWG